MTIWLTKKRFLFDSRIELKIKLILINALLEKNNTKQIKSFINKNKVTIKKCKKNLQRNIKEKVIDKNLKIGGIGIILEIDESKFCKRKFH